MSEEDNGSRDIEAICAAHAHKQGPLLPVLHDVQRQQGCVSTEAIGRIARYLNLSRAEVYGVVTFYHDFRQVEPRRHVLKVCRAEACQAVGGRAVWATAESLAAESGCAVEVEAVYCLGNCPCAPSVQFDGRTLGRFTAERVSGLITGASGSARS